MGFYTDYPKYPTSIFDDTDYPNQTDDVDTIYAALVNALKEELQACFAELGTLPKGVHASVKARLEALELQLKVELDYFEYADDAAAQVEYVSSSEPVSWDITNDCSSLVGWTVVGGGGGTAPSQETFDGKSTFKFLNSGDGTSNSYCYKDLGTIASDYTVDIDIYFDLLGLFGDTDSMRLMIRQDATHTLMLIITTDKVMVYDGAGWVEVATPTITQDAWQTWRFVVDGTAQTVDIYRYNLDSGVWDTIATGADCSYSGGGEPGEFRLDTFGFTIAVLVYLDNIRIEDGKFPPNLQCYSSIIKQQGTYSLKCVAAQTDSLNDTLTRTVSPTIDLTTRNIITLWAYSNRTGENFKVEFHDSGGNTISYTVNILIASTWEKKEIDISAVAGADKDSIDEIKYTILNADAIATFYLDNNFAT